MSISQIDRHCTDCGETWIDAPGFRGHGCANAGNQTGFHAGDRVLVGGLPGVIDELGPVMASVYFQRNFQTRHYPLTMLVAAEVSA